MVILENVYIIYERVIEIKLIYESKFSSIQLLNCFAKSQVPD